MLRLVAAAERESEHPLAEAIVAAAEGRELPVGKAERFEGVPGHGAIATVEGKRLAEIAAISMSGSSILVAVNAIALKRLRLPGRDESRA